MKIKKIHLDEFKRFTDLTIDNIPETAKLVVLIGPNGCGKTSLFEAFKVWHRYKGYQCGTQDEKYCKKNNSDGKHSWDQVSIEFHAKIEDIRAVDSGDAKKHFYFRTAYRNSPAITVSSIGQISSPLKNADQSYMIDNDSTVNENYQRLIAQTLEKVFDTSYDETHVKILRDEILAKIRAPLSILFPDLLLTKIAAPTEKAEIYFEKGIIKEYGYNKLSGGEKAVFDLLLDIVIKREFYTDTVYCIDEPETHIHTKVQSALLSELFNLIPDSSQLWIATHSFGMLKEAKRLSQECPDQVVFLNFDGYDFDDQVTIEPSDCDSTLWDKMMEISLDNYASLFSPETIVFCEGDTQGNTRKNFDAQCYSTIFKNEFPNTKFYSAGNCKDITNDKNKVVEFMRFLSKGSKIIQLLDRDDLSDNEVSELKNKDITVLSRRHLESYLLDKEVIKKWCTTVEQPNKIDEAIEIYECCLNDSITNGKNPSDDIKSAGNEICTKIKKLLGLKRCGNNGEAIMRDTISQLITDDMEVYKELKKSIFE